MKTNPIRHASAYRLFFLTAALCFYCIASVTAGGRNDSAQVFLHMQGVRTEKMTYYETEGYGISTHSFNLSFDARNIRLLNKKYSIPKGTEPTLSKLYPDATIYAINERTDSGSNTVVYYYFRTSEGKINMIGFSTQTTRDTSIEHRVIDAILANEVPEYVYTTVRTNSFRLAGRDVPVGNGCAWPGLHNLQCHGNGQISWSEFSDESRAIDYIKSQQAGNMRKKNFTLLEQNRVKVIFEGTEVWADRVKVKFKIPPIVMGGSNILIIYYLTAPVRGRYVAATLSHYTDNPPVDDLSPLLVLVMSLVK